MEVWKDTAHPLINNVALSLLISSVGAQSKIIVLHGRPPKYVSYVHGLRKHPVSFPSVK